MLKWAFIFLIVAVVAGAMGLTGIEGVAAGISKTLFFVFITIFVILLVAGLALGRKMRGR